MTMPITKYNFIVKDVNRLATVIRRAFTIAQTGRPGPVLVDITKDVTAAPCEYEKQVPEEIVRQSDTITEQDMDRAVEMIRKASKPFIFVGGGAVLSNASDELRAFAHKIQAPVADSLMGKGAFDGADELYTGMVGMHGTKSLQLRHNRSRPADCGGRQVQRPCDRQCVQICEECKDSPAGH